MLLLTILSGKSAPAAVRFRRTTVSVGRGPAHDLSLNDDGVWEQHLQVRLGPDHQFLVRCRPEAQTVVNGQPVHECPLRNGDVIELGAAKVRFGFSETRLRSHRVREAATWALIVWMVLAQISLIYALSLLFV
jgi:pSer/pThr/pTyr-binding forkhead associated (FHA) protein